MRTNRFSWLLTTLATAAVLTVARPVIAAESARSGETAATRRVVVSIPDRKLALLENDQVVGIYPVAVGASVSPSPVGTFTIVNRVSNPTYYKPGRSSARAARIRSAPAGLGSARRATASTAPTHPRPSALPNRTAASACAIRTSNSSSPASAAATSSSSMPSARRRSRSCSATFSDPFFTHTGGCHVAVQVHADGG